MENKFVHGAIPICLCRLQNLLLTFFFFKLLGVHMKLYIWECLY